MSLIPGAAPWGLYKSTDGGATWTFLHNGAASAALVRHGRRGDRRRLAVFAARRASRRARSRPIPTSSTPARTARGVWRSTDAGATWIADQAVARTRPTPTCGPSSPSRRCRAAQTRMYVHEGSRAGQSQLAAVPQRRRVASGVAGVPDPVEQQPGRSRLRHATTSAPVSAGTTTSSTRRPVIPTSSTSAARTRYGEHFSNKRGVVLSTDAGVSVDRHDDGRHRLPAPERPASRSARARHQPEQPVPVLRGQRRRRHALERRVRGRVVVVRRPQPRS